jgi:hypothetical protein
MHGTTMQLETIGDSIEAGKVSACAEGPTLLSTYIDRKSVFHMSPGEISTLVKSGHTVSLLSVDLEELRILPSSSPDPSVFMEYPQDQ